MCKGPEVGTSEACSEIEAIVAAVECSEGREVDEAEEAIRAQIMGAL